METPLHNAAYKGHKDVVQLLMERGAELNIQRQHGFTPLHDAVQARHTDIVQLLLDRGAEPKKVYFMGGTPLCIGGTPLCRANKMDDMDIAYLLKENKGKLNKS